MQIHLLSGCLLLLCWSSLATSAAAIPLFDGKTFTGWVGDTNRTWRINDGALVGGSLEKNIPQNEFLRTVRSYTNFVLRLKFKLVGTSGFVNAGVQIRSQPVANPPNEMRGYQCDIGEGWWGHLYDESRRNKVLVKAKPEVEPSIKRNGWNEYVIRCEGRRIQSWINGVQAVDYTEPDPGIEQFGLIGLQIHGGAKAEVAYRDITVEEL